MANEASDAIDTSGAGGKMTCPACGGAGGGPIGRAGAGWDIESYECIRCGGEGWVTAASEAEREARLAAAAAATATPRPGIAKAQPPRETDAKKPRRSGTDSN